MPALLSRTTVIGMRRLVQCRFFSSHDSQKPVTLTFSKQGGLAVITMQRPEAKNAISKQFLHDLIECTETVRRKNDVRAVLLRSTVPGVFCAGADLKERAKMSEGETRAFVCSLRDSFSSIASLPQPTIACIDGVALGGGLEVALACDFRVASKGSTVGLPETALAIIPGAGGTQRLPRLIGHQKAKYLVLTAKRLAAPEGVDYGILDFVQGVNCSKLVHKTVDEYKDILNEGDSEEATPGFVLGVRLAKEILPQGPVAIRAAKKAMRDGMQTDIATAMDVERACYDMVLKTQDRLEALAAFKEKRAPVFKGM